MPSSTDKRREQQRARRAAAAAAKTVAQVGVDGAASMCGGSSFKLTSDALGAAGISVMHADLDDLVTASDGGALEQQWRGGANRQAQPDAHEHQVDASRAAAHKRSAEAAPPEERAAKRNAAKRDKRAREAAVAEVLGEIIEELVDMEREEDEEREEEVADVLYDLIDKVIDEWMIDEQPSRKRLNKRLRRAGEDTIDDSLGACQRPAPRSASAMPRATIRTPPRDVRRGRCAERAAVPLVLRERGPKHFRAPVARKLLPFYGNPVHMYTFTILCRNGFTFTLPPP